MPATGRLLLYFLAFGVAGYAVAGTTNSARWGAIVRFTKHLDVAENEIFARQYMCVPRVKQRG